MENKALPSDSNPTEQGGDVTCMTFFPPHGPKLGDWFPLPRGNPVLMAEFNRLGTDAWMEHIGKIKDVPEFEFAEHSRLGDLIGLLWTDKGANGSYNRWPAFACPFTLPNGLRMTYGLLNALSGDFYGPNTPISDEPTLQAQKARFMELWYWLAVDKTQTPAEVPQILVLLNEEVNIFNQALKDKQDPAAYYAKYAKQLEAMNVEIGRLTLSRRGHKGYLGLALQNWDHFGERAMTAYCAGHAAAMEIAKIGTNEALYTAYAMNACADHFLEDQFSSGHMRTPRKELSGGADFLALAKCAQNMHDEDSAIGLNVFNKDPEMNGKGWTAYGDKRLMSDVDDTNYRVCRKALQASADEIHEVWRTKTVKPVGDFALWKLRPQLVNDAEHQQLVPLFKKDLSRRRVIKDRRTWDFEDSSSWWAWSTAMEIEWSGWWKYKMTLDGGGSS